MAISDYLSGIDEYTGGAKADVQRSGEELARVSGDAATLPFKLKEALQQKLDYNKDIIGQSTEALGDYIATPAESRARNENVWNPFQREAIVARDRATAFEPYKFFQDVLGQRMGQVSDIVGQGVAGWQGIVQQANALAQLAQQKYSQAFQEYTTAAGLQQDEDQMRQAQEQWEKEFGLSQAKFDWQKIQDGLKGTGTGIRGVTAADKETRETWDEMVELAGGNPDTLYAMIQRDDAMLRRAGVDVNALYAAQAAWRDSPSGISPEAANEAGVNYIDWWKNRGALGSDEKLFGISPGLGADDRLFGIGGDWWRNLVGPGLGGYEPTPSQAQEVPRYDLQNPVTMDEYNGYLRFGAQSPLR